MVDCNHVHQLVQAAELRRFNFSQLISNAEFVENLIKRFLVPQILRDRNDQIHQTERLDCDYLAETA